MQTQHVGVKTMLGVGCVTMAVLASEIALTRIFSVTLWYHFAFLVISLALLGSGAAGVWLMVKPEPFAGARAPRMLPWLALGYAVSQIAAFLIYQEMPLSAEGLRDGLDAGEIGWLAAMYAELTIPFIFAGATVALALRHYQARAGRLYFADLVGASLGCVLSVAALVVLGAPGVMLVTATLGALGAWLLALDGGVRSARLATGVALVAGVVTLGAQVVDPWLTLRLHKTYNDTTPIYQAWNAFSLVTVYEDPWPIPFGWGISQRYFERPRPDPGHLMVLIDEKAGTPIQRHRWENGQEDWEALDFLTYDLTALPYYLRRDAEVFIVGPGGGRDVLTALLFGARRVVGAELNEIIYNLVRFQYADYAGHIYSRPNVTIHVDDARTFLAANADRFDIIQASLIDTFASTSAGAFALSENGIYTVEAFEAYYHHLKDDGMVNFSRWYFADGPAETLRLVSVGLQAWENMGVEDVQQHVVVVANLTPDRIVNEGLAGMLLKKTPFTQAELDIIAQQAERLDFAVLYAPGVTADNPVAELVTAPDRQAYIEAYPLDITPSTDDRPFFFNVVRLGDLGKDEFARSAIYGLGAQATRTLLLTLGISVGLTLILIIAPLVLGRGGALQQSQGGALIGYYAMLGLGFILVEVPMIQKLSIYMGNPTYALALILFSLLLFSGIGSYLSQSVRPESIVPNLRLGLGALVALMVAYLVGMPLVLQATQGLPIVGRALVVVALMMPAGLLMGRPFPLGLRYVEGIGATNLTPWLWAANGTLSVVGSVAATIMAMNLGFRVTFAVGALAYLIAAGLTFQFAPRRQIARAADVAAPAAFT